MFQWIECSGAEVSCRGSTAASWPQAQTLQQKCIWVPAPTLPRTTQNHGVDAAVSPTEANPAQADLGTAQGEEQHDLSISQEYNFNHISPLFLWFHLPSEQNNLFTAWARAL